MNSFLRAHHCSKCWRCPAVGFSVGFHHRSTSSSSSSSSLLPFSSHCLPSSHHSIASFHHLTRCSSSSYIVPLLSSGSGVNKTSNAWISTSTSPLHQQRRLLSQRDDNKEKSLSSLIVPLKVEPETNEDQEEINIGEEIVGRPLDKLELSRVLNEFFRKSNIKKLSFENGMDSKLFQQAFISFRQYCVTSAMLPPELHVALSDIIQGHGHVDDLFRFFLLHCRRIYPHLECIEELKKVSDLRLPVHWYPEARAIERKIIFHAGPTNSGKTYNALKAFMDSESGLYCGPLKLLAVEVHEKANNYGTKCDLVTGEERRFADPDGNPSNHVACTVEMASTMNQCDVAIIDEIQMIRDPQRGWAWTRALLGIPAKEIHLCGEEAALDVIREMLMPICEEVQVHRYNRLTSLTIAEEAINSLENVQPGDCIVCFNKNDLYSVTLQLEKLGHEVAVIYGGLPPGTKLSQAKKFNDPNDSCKVLVATDAIGMGLNLSIRRVIFYSIMKPSTNQKGEKEIDLITTSSALQIAGRAGRFNSDFEKGFVTTFKNEDLAILKQILAQPVEPIPAAGLHPTADQIELFAYHLPQATLSNLIDIFVSLCQVDTTNYFMCNVEDFKFLADMIQHVPLPLRTRYVFCCAPINKNNTFACTMFLKFARQYSQNEPITLDWLSLSLNLPFTRPNNITDLAHLESVFDVFDLYLWLSYRFPDLFPDADLVRETQKQLDDIIYVGVCKIARLFHNSSSRRSTESMREKNIVQMRRKRDILKQLRASSPEPTLHEQQPQLSSSSSSSSSVSNAELNGSLTDQLISTGLLTPKLVEQLQKEWYNNVRTKDRSLKKKRK